MEVTQCSSVDSAEHDAGRLEFVEVRFGEAVPARPSKLLELEALSATISDHSQSFEYVTSLSVP